MFYYKVSNKNNMTHINLLSWIQEQDYDAWLALYEYLEPIIMMRRSLPRLRRDEWFQKMLIKHKIDDENIKPTSIYYNRYVNYNSKIDTNVHTIERNFAPTKLYICGIECHTEPIYDYTPGAGWLRVIKGYRLSINATKDEIFKSVKAYSDIPIKKSWTKGRMLIALVPSIGHLV